MIKTIFYLILGIVLLAWYFDVSLHFKPFKISINKEEVFIRISWLMIIFSATCLRIASHDQAYKKGLQNGAEIQRKVIMEQIDNMKKGTDAEKSI